MRWEGRGVFDFYPVFVKCLVARGEQIVLIIQLESLVDHTLGKVECHQDLFRVRKRKEREGKGEI